MPRSDRVEDAVENSAALVTPNWDQAAHATAGLPPRIKPSGHSLDYETAEDDGWIGTLVFLIGLVLFGVVTGYLLRGGNAQGSELATTMPSALVSVAAQSPAQAADAEALPVIAAFGSDAPDELLSLDVLSNSGAMAGLVRLHNTRRDGPDRVSFVLISPNGRVTETELQGGSLLRGAEISEMAGGEYIAASLSADSMTIQNLDRAGDVDWLRSFPVSQTHVAKVDVATVAGGSFTIGPAERPDRIGLVHLGIKGDLIWQRSFPADPERPDVQIVAGSDETVFVTMRNISANMPSASHTLMRIASDGQVMWKHDLDIGDMNSIAGFELASDGHVLVLASGAVPSLSKYNSRGIELWASLVPNISQQDTLHLVTGDSGEAIVASPYSLLGQRMYLMLQRWGADGVPLAEAELTLPPQSTLEVIARGDRGELVLAGSILPDRYEDPDISIKSAVLRDDIWTDISAAPEPMVLSFASEDGGEMKVAASAVPTDIVSRRTLSEDAADVLPNAEQVAAQIAPDDEPTVPATASDVQEAVAEPAETILATSSEIVDSALNAAAQSMLLNAENLSQAQCRFTCLEQRGAATFPMWASVEAPTSTFASGLTEVHSQVCKAARGRIYADARPDCQFVPNN